MDNGTKLSAFAKYAWFVLAYNVLVILWGVFLRASHSGDGCGQHWLTCGGEVVPTAPQFKTVIEYSHRITTAFASIAVFALVVWAFRRFPKGSPIRKAASLGAVFIVIESLIGAGLVLTGNTAGNWTPTRPLWTIGHLINTVVLLVPLTLTAWLASRPNPVRYAPRPKVAVLLGIGLAVFFAAAISGSMAALSNMFFPSDSLAGGFIKDFDPDSHLLLRLRIFHPLLSILGGVALVFVGGAIRKAVPDSKGIEFWAKALTGLVAAQIAFGALTLLMLAPILMQLGHLLLADAVWIAFVFMSAYALTDTEN